MVVKLPCASKKTRQYKIKPKNANQAFYADFLAEKLLVFGLGPAGTGKTYLAVAAALDKLATGVVERILISRPIVEAGERLGFLPGTLEEKVSPYMRPIYDMLNELIGKQLTEKLLANGTIEIAPLAYMRGRTLSRAAIILDEAQNATKEQMKLFLTRLGEQTFTVVTGDPSQIDLPKKHDSGLIEASTKLSKLEEVGIVTFDEVDVVRSALAKKIVAAYSS